MKFITTTATLINNNYLLTYGFAVGGALIGGGIARKSKGLLGPGGLSASAPALPAIEPMYPWSIAARNFAPLRSSSVISRILLPRFKGLFGMAISKEMLKSGRSKGNMLDHNVFSP